MVKIRLRRMGAKKAPFYRIVVADSRCPRDGRFIEEIGTYDPWRGREHQGRSRARKVLVPTVLSLPKPYAACLLKSRHNKEKLPA